VITAYKLVGGVLKQLDLENLPKASKSGDYWLHVEGDVSPADLVRLEKFGLSYLAQKWLIEEDHGVRFQRFDSGVLIQSPYVAVAPEGGIQESTFSIVFENNLVIARVPVGFPFGSRELENLGSSQLVAKTQLEGVFWAFLDSLTSGAMTQISKIESMTREMENVLFEKGQFDETEQLKLLGLAKSTTAIRVSVLPLRETLAALHRYDLNDRDYLYPYFLDLQAGIDRVATASTEVRDQIASLVNINLSLENKRQTQISKRISSWAAIIAVPTAVTGFFGQNIPFVGFQSVEGVVLSTTLIACSSLVLFVTFRNRGWL
jgi:magnesium transporter